MYFKDIKQNNVDSRRYARPRPFAKTYNTEYPCMAPAVFSSNFVRFNTLNKQTNCYVNK